MEKGLKYLNPQSRKFLNSKWYSINLEGHAIMLLFIMCDGEIDFLHVYDLFVSQFEFLWVCPLKEHLLHYRCGGGIYLHQNMKQFDFCFRSVEKERGWYLRASFQDISTKIKGTIILSSWILHLKTMSLQNCAMFSNMGWSFLCFNKCNKID